MNDPKCLTDRDLFDLFYGESEEAGMAGRLPPQHSPRSPGGEGSRLGACPRSPPQGERPVEGAVGAPPLPELEASVAGTHLAACPRCRKAWEAFAHDLRRIDDVADPVPEGGSRALAAALRVLEPAVPSAPADTLPGGLPEPVPAFAPGAGDILTLAEVALYLRIEVEQARALLRELPHLDLGGIIRIRRPTFEAYLARLEQESTGRTALEPCLPDRVRLHLI